MSKQKTVRPADAEQTTVDVPAQEADTLGGDTPGDATPADSDPGTDSGDDTADPADAVDPAGESDTAADPRSAALANLVNNPDTPGDATPAPEPIEETGRTRHFTRRGETFIVAAPRFSTSGEGRIITAYRGDRVVVDTDAQPVQHAIEHGYLRPVE